MFYFRVKSQYVDLPEDFRVELILENPLLLQDRIPMPYTTSSEFVLTPANKVLFDNPDRINLKDRVWEYDGCVMGFGARPLYYGLMIIEEVGNRLMWNFQASDDLSATKSNMNEIDLGRLDFGFGSIISRQGPDWNTGVIVPSPAMTSYRDEILASLTTDKDYTTAPIKIAGEDIPSMFDDDTLVYVGSLFGQNRFFNPFSNNQGHLAYLQFAGVFEFTQAHAPIYPQLRVGYFIKKLLGLPDAYNPFLADELFKLVLTSHYHPKFRDDLVSRWSGVLLDNEYPTEFTFDNFFIKFQSFQPALQSSVVLKSMLNLVAGTLFRYQEGASSTYKILLASDIIADPEIRDWDHLLGSKLILSREIAQPYIFGFDDFDEEDPAIDPAFVLATIEDLLTASVDPITFERSYYIQTTRQLILKKLAPKAESTDPDEYTYEVRHSGLERANSSTGYQITSAISPLKMTPVINLVDFATRPEKPEILAYLPVYEGQRSVNYKPHVMIYQGMISNPLNTDEPTFFGDHVYPYLSYHNYDPAGNRLGDLSLHWNGPDGLIDRYHKHFMTWMERDRLAGYGEFIFSPYYLKDIDFAKKYLVRSKAWWIKKITVPLTKKKIEPARVDLVEAPEVPVDAPGGSGSSGSPGSGSGGGGVPGEGTCYTIEINTLVFDPEADYFNISFTRPGESQTTVGYVTLPSVDDGDTIRIFICSVEMPFFTQLGEVVGSVSGVTMEAGGACSTDGECLV